MIKDPIIFIGTGRSGTSLVSSAVLSHKSLGYPSNYQHKFPKILLINFIKRLYDNRLWRFYTRANKTSVFHKLMFLPAEAYNMWRYLTFPEINFSRDFLIDEEASIEQRNRIRTYFEDMLKFQGKERLALKVTGPSRIGYLLSIFPDARFIWVKREVIPTVSSFMNVSFWKTRGMGKIWFQGAYSERDTQYIKTLNNHPAELTAFQIGRIIASTKQEIEKHNAEVLEIDYTKFLKNPKDQMISILDFLNLKYDKACFNYIDYIGIKNNIKSDLEYYEKINLKYIYTAYNNGLKF